MGQDDAASPCLVDVGGLDGIGGAMPSASMKRQALIAALWSGGDALARHGVQFATTLVLARLLTPADFGLMAMLAVFIGIAGVLADGGFSVALIQRLDVDHVDESTVFWCNLALGGVLATGLFTAAPWLADFYGEPRLRDVARVMALVVVAGAAMGVQAALLARQLDFKTQALAGGLAAVVAGSASIAMALQGYGVWALVVQAVAMSVLNCLLLWCFSQWRPAVVFSLASIRKLVGFSGYHLASTLLETAYSRLFGLLAGKRFGASAAGYYANAENTRQLPASLIGVVVTRIAIPVFARVQGEPDKMRRGLQLANRAMMLVYAPMMLALIALAEPIVELLYGRQWLPAVAPLQVLALAGLLYPLHMVNLHALIAGGHARKMFKVELAKKASGILFLAVGASFGLMGLAWSQVVHSLVALTINTHYAGKWFDYGAFRQLRDVAPVVLVAGVVFPVAGYAASAWKVSGVMETTAMLSLGVAMYSGLILLLRLEVGNEALGLLASLRKEPG